MLMKCSVKISHIRHPIPHRKPTENGLRINETIMLFTINYSLKLKHLSEIFPHLNNPR